MQMRIVVLVFLLLWTSPLLAQNCTTLGQTPSTAFPVCAATTFSQANVPICSSHTLNVPGCPGGNGLAYEDRNPFWYKFTCYTAGTLGFLITPNDLGDDYDWMLYDITGHAPDEVFTNNSLVVTGNWAGTFGVTGASNAGVNFIQCASDPADNRNSFSKMPTLVVGHQYLLLVSHFTNSQSGYKLGFGGGTAVITDPKLPKLQNATPGCAGVTVTVTLNKKMKCRSLAADGSDFTLSPANATVVAATAIGCSNSFDMDTVVLTLSTALTPGNYTLTIQNGGDGNTLLDNCDRNIPPGDQLPFSIAPLQPTPMDSLSPVGCAPGILELVFRKPIMCSSIAADGSDFRVVGTTPVTITGASGTCVNGVTATIRVQLAAPLQTAGNYEIQLVTGFDGNPIVDACGQVTPVGARINFTTKDTVNAGFTHQLIYGCEFDTVVCGHDGRNGVNEWSWNFDNVGSSQLQNPTFVFPTFGLKNIQLLVSNGVCKDTADATVNLDNALKAAFGYPDVLCPEDLAVFTDSSIGNIVSWHWDFGNNTTSLQQEPAPQKYPPVTTGLSKFYTVQLIVQNNHNCFDTAKHQLKVVNSCYIDVPNAFTPNGDYKNDYLYPLNAWKAVKLEFKVFNRYGQLIFQTNDWTRKWDGTIHGHPQSTGVFVWMLSYTHKETGERVFKKGTTVLIR
jgi:gliding motility-associated-like protein